MAKTVARGISEDERAAILNSAIANFARDGWTISAVFAGQAVAQRKVSLGGDKFWIAGIFWTVNILLAVFTGGLWLIALIVLYLSRATETVVIAVDEQGNVTTS